MAGTRLSMAQSFTATWTQGQRLVPDFTGTLRVTNNTSSTVDGYYVEFEVNAYYSQISTHSGTVSSLGGHRYRWQPPTWGSGTSLAPGATADISVNAKYTGISVVPFNTQIGGQNIDKTAFDVNNLSPLFPSPCGAPECAPAAGYDPSKKVIGYFISWGVYGRNFHVEDIRADRITHINFAFANINPSSYRIVVGDEFADLQKEGGSFDKLYQLKKYYPHLKTLISVGGWTWSTHFYEAAATPANRKAFAESVREFLVKYGFDGVDLDWEYPGGGGNDPGKGGPQDGVNYTKLVQAIRAELDAQQAEDGKYYYITAALGAGTSKIDAMDVPGFFSVVDWANIMTYDMNGAWAKMTGHHAALYNSAGNGVGQNPDGSPIIDPKFNVKSAINHYMQKGAPASKLTAGLPIYSREWRDVKAGNSNGLYQPSTANQPPPGSWDEPGVPSGVHDYKDLVSSYINKNGYVRYWDDVAKAPYLYNPNQMGGHFISYEDTQSLGHKLNYISDQNLAGAMFWELTQDVAPGPNSLIDKIYEGIMAGGCAPNCPNNPPTVSITAPASGDSFNQGTDIVITAQASDTDGQVTKVEFFDGQAKIGEDRTAPYSFTYKNASLGAHSITAVSTDDDNATTRSGAVSINVIEPDGNVPPSVSITSPANGATADAGSTVSVQATATDTDGNVTLVEFYANGSKLGEDRTAPFSYSWSNVSAGSYTISAKATDNDGASTTSQGISITIKEVTDGGGCAGVVQYAAGTTYTQDQQVKNLNKKYRCDIPGWCSSGAAWAYAPGEGMHWTDAWTLLGDCGTTDPKAPTVTLTAPANGSTYTEGDNIVLNASASDPDGSVVKVEFYNGSTKLGEDSSAPYSFTLVNAAIGTYNFTAKATDDTGLTNTSASVSATVDAAGGDGCGGIVQYVAGNAYTQNQEVKNVKQRFRCDIPGWCSSGAAWAYAPGEGMHWTDAWTLLGDCTGDGNSAPQVNITSPTSGSSFTAGTVIIIKANASDSDGTIGKVEFYRNGVKIGEDATAPYEVSWTATAGGAGLTAVATDDDGASKESAVVNISVTSDGGGNGGNLPKRLMVGYWHNFNNGSGTVKLRNVSDKWDVINIAFAEPSTPSGSNMVFTPDPAIYSSVQEFKDDVAYLKGKGKTVLISIGGANGAVDVSSSADAQEFSTSMINIINQYGFSGMDIDLEGSSLSLTAGDNDFRNPVSPKIVYFIQGAKTVVNSFGEDFVLSMAPETAFVQGGFSTYAGAYGAYLPVIYALMADMDYIHVQHYNSGCMLGLDGRCYSQGTPDFHVAMAEMLLQGFPVAGNAADFPALRQDQVAIGLPAAPAAAGGGYTSPANVQKALDYLIKGVPFGGNYVLRNANGYSNFRGLMTWSINWDLANNSEFSNSHRPYLDALDGAALNNASSLLESSAVKPKSEFYPNPMANDINVVFEMENAGEVSVVIFDHVGKKWVIMEQVRMDAGEHIVEWDAGHLKSGIYHIKLSVNGQVTNYRIYKN